MSHRDRESRLSDADVSKNFPQVVFGGTDGTRLFKMGKWALKTRLRLSRADDATKDFLQGMIDEALGYLGISMCDVDPTSNSMMVGNVIVDSSHGGTSLGTQDMKWYEDWFGGFLWVTCNITHFQANAYYFSEEMQKFWDDVFELRDTHKNVNETDPHMKDAANAIDNYKWTFISETRMTYLMETISKVKANQVSCSPGRSRSNQCHEKKNKRMLNFDDCLPQVKEEENEGESDACNLHSRTQTKPIGPVMSLDAIKRTTHGKEETQSRTGEGRGWMDVSNDNAHIDTNLSDVNDDAMADSEVGVNGNGNLRSRRGREKGKGNVPWIKKPLDGFAWGQGASELDVYNEVRSWGNCTWVCIYTNKSSKTAQVIKVISN